jgi:hypothetical protein
VGPRAGPEATLKKNNSQSPPGIEPRSSSPWRVAIPTEISRLFTHLKICIITSLSLCIGTASCFVHSLFSFIFFPSLLPSSLFLS